MKRLGLTDAQIAARRNFIGGSDALAIVSGDWFPLWEQKTGRAVSRSILSPWDAAVRHTLEPLILDWYEETNGRPITRRGETVVHAEHRYLGCNLDGWDAALAKPIDAKALNIWTPNPLQWCIEHYTPQMHHQMIVTGATCAALHVSLGMKEPQPIEIELDEFFAATYIESCRDFWRFVEADEPPPGGPVLTVPVAPDAMRTVSMAGSNAWGAAAGDWLANKESSSKFLKAGTELKALVEADVREAFGHGVRVTRDKRGLSVKESK